MKRIPFLFSYRILVLSISLFVSGACHSPKPAVNTPSKTISTDNSLTEKVNAPKDSTGTKVGNEPSEFFE